MDRKILSWALVAATALLSLVLLMCVETPTSNLAHILSTFIPVPDVAASDYDADIAAASREAPALRAPLYDDAEKKAQAELAASPMKPDAWLRLSYVRALSGGAFSNPTAAAFLRSYTSAPIDPVISAWRIHFGLENWSALNGELKAYVVAELKTVWTSSPARRPSLIASVTSIDRSEGRAAGEAILTDLGWDSKNSK